jgi:hypothetical protein
MEIRSINIQARTSKPMMTSSTMTGTSFTTWGLIVSEKVGSRKKESEARMARKLGRDSDGEVFQIRAAAAGSRGRRQAMRAKFV